MKKYTITCLIFLSFIGNLLALAQNGILERRITIKLQDKPVSTILNIISETNQFYFSYDPTKVNTQKVRSIHAINKPVKEVLDDLFENKISYQQISNHIILKPKPMVKEPKTRKNKPTIYYYQLSGYLTDELSGLGINGISVYEKNKLNYTTSGDFGYYELKFSSKKESEWIYFTSPLISDTSILIKGTSSPEKKDLSFPLAYKGRSLSPIKTNDHLMDSPQLEPLTIHLDTQRNYKNLLQEQINKLNELGLGKKIASKSKNLINLNVTDSFERLAQISFFTPIGSNGQLSSKVSNKYSLNVVAGYHRSSEVFELGGFANVLSHHMNGVQIAGFGNYVGGNVNGLQIGGFSNHNSKNINGLGIAGFYNFIKQNTKGTLVAGFANWSQGNVYGSQIAGIMNKAKNVQGAQIAGFMNKANKVQGVQFGFINISDTMEGVPIGFINIVKNGIHQFEASYNYASDYSLLFRTGAERLYTIIGLRSNNLNVLEDEWIGVEYGVGSNIKLLKPLLLNIELSSYQPTKSFRYDYLRLNNQGRINIEFRPIKKLAFFAGTGMSVNVLSANDPSLSEIQRRYGNQYILDNGGATRVGMNPSWQFGLRIL